MRKVRLCSRVRVPDGFPVALFFQSWCSCLAAYLQQTPGHCHATVGFVGLFLARRCPQAPWSILCGVIVSFVPIVPCHMCSLRCIIFLVHRARIAAVQADVLRPCVDLARACF
eukprot:TRINITY_DN8556_c0_g2_i1.p3 TRINITY_DN8556_c0_g2~~TRINITY_DN8556_c0_g2_i1.p3  ORF type:complete len:113 (-),score=0.82 TRINITY_DN8556_c0_g2_i1:48-386(-)